MRTHHTSTVLVCLLAIVTLFGCASCSDPVVREISASNATRINIRAFRDWEASVPLYLEMRMQDGTKLTSGPFYYSLPEELKTSGERLQVKEGNGLIYVVAQDAPKKILSIVDTKRPFIYPPNGLRQDAYYDTADALLKVLKEHLGVADLELYR